MTPESRSAISVARQLWADAVQRSASPEHVLVVADQLLTDLDVQLRRWIGAEGYAALLNRSVTLALPQHAALARFSDLHVGSSAAPPSSATTSAFSDADTAEALVALLVVMMEQLGSIVGADMAVRLLAVHGSSNTRGVASHDSNETTS